MLQSRRILPHTPTQNPGANQPQNELEKSLEKAPKFTPAEVTILRAVCEACQEWDSGSQHCRLCASGPTRLWLRQARCKKRLWPSWAAWPPPAPSTPPAAEPSTATPASPQS